MNPIDTSALALSDPLEIKEELGCEVLELDEATARAFAPIAVEVTVRKDVEGKVTVVGSLKTTLKLLCGRCAEWLPWPVSIPVDHEFEPPYENLLDLVALFREDILLELPLIPVCQLGSEGRCPITGEIHLSKPEASVSLASEALWNALSKIKTNK